MYKCILCKSNILPCILSLPYTIVQAIAALYIWIPQRNGTLVYRCGMQSLAAECAKRLWGRESWGYEAAGRSEAPGHLFNIIVLSRSAAVQQDARRRPRDAERDRLHEELIASQKTIIDLQIQLIQAKDEQLKSVTSAVEWKVDELAKEVRDYSAAVKSHVPEGSSSRHAGIPSAEVRTAVKTALLDHADEEGRDCNVIFSKYINFAVTDTV